MSHWEFPPLISNCAQLPLHPGGEERNLAIIKVVSAEEMCYDRVVHAQVSGPMIKLAYTLQPAGLRDFYEALLPKVIISREHQSKHLWNKKVWGTPLSVDLCLCDI